MIIYWTPNWILVDHASYHQSFSILSYLLMLWIKLWFSEAYYYHHQKPFKRRYQTFKQIVNQVMDRTNTPFNLWFLCMEYVAYILSCMSDSTLGNRHPILQATGTMGDISPILSFQWLEPIYYFKTHNTSFPSESPETMGYFVGFSNNVGHIMVTYKIWNKKNNKILNRSAVRSAKTPNVNLKATSPESELDPTSSHPPSLQ